MIRNLTLLTLLILPATVLLSASGCDDERVAKIATEAADRQAEQNTTMAKLQQEVAAGSKSLVEESAAARQDLLSAHHELYDERTALNDGWNDLEAQRQEIDRNRRGGALLLDIGKALVGLLVVFSVLGFCRQVLRGSGEPDAGDVELQELLVDQLVASHPKLPSSVAPPAIARDDHEQSTDNG